MSLRVEKLLFVDYSRKVYYLEITMLFLRKFYTKEGEHDVTVDTRK